MDNKFNKILITDLGKTKKLVLNRPDKRNSLDEEMISEISCAMNKFSSDEETKSIVITGAGANFCSGLNLEYLHKISEYDVLQNKKDSDNFKNMLLSIYNCKKPTIAMVNGYALAGGCGIASACDLIVAADKAQFGYTEVKIGFIPAIVMVFLLKRVTETHAKDLLLLSKFITGSEAYKIGFVNYVVDEYMLESYTDKLCECLNELPSSSVMLTKEMFKNVASMSFESALEYAVDMNALTRMTDECKNGIKRFLTKK
ncbi:MAG: enoyl-CoA hydratase/isomerase family protein [Ignavibacteriae bacterium]|nr:enoyl-CoA hydratase/isomerase family protein [Ignavibacteriota bacterium]